MPLTIPFTFTPDTLADANQVNADFQAVATFVNGLPSPPFTIAQGGTGSTTAVGALTSLGAGPFFVTPAVAAFSGTQINLTTVSSAPTPSTPPAANQLFGFLSPGALTGPFTVSINGQTPIPLYDGPAALVQTGSVLVDQYMEIAYVPALNAGSGGALLVNPQPPGAATNTVLTGSIFWWPTPNVPAGYLECNGAPVSRTTYAALFAVSGGGALPFGPGDASTTFNVPNIEGYFVRGWDRTGSIDPGRGFGTTQTGSIISHTHSLTVAGTGSTGSGGDPTPAVAFSPSSIATGATGGTETRPINIALLPIIKT